MRAFALGTMLFFCLAASCTTPRRVFPTTDPALPFSNAVQVGRTLYVAGHLGLDPDTGKPPADAAAEAERLLDAFSATLARAGMTMDDLVMVQVHCVDPDLYDVFNAVYRARFTASFPARAFLGSGKLLAGCRFEMLGIAVRP